MKLIAIVLFVLTTMLVSVAAYSVERRCSYKLFVKSDRERISSVALPNGNVVSRGSNPRVEGAFPGAAHLDYKREARLRAAKAMKRCLDAAINARNAPRACKPRRLGNKDGAMETYDIPNLQKLALKTICQAARSLGRKGRLNGVMVYATNTTNLRGNDEKQCNIQDDKPDKYYTPAGGKGLQVNCSATGAGADSKVTRGESKTGWYDESASQIKTRIKNYCQRTFASNNYEIIQFAVRQRNGKLMATFRCK